jgi:Holliday junction resolvase-like predicted endonuclease
MAMKSRSNDTTCTAAVRGQAAEALAARHLARHGLSVVVRNFRIRGGEIDLICCVLLEELHESSVEWIKNAFAADD